MTTCPDCSHEHREGYGGICIGCPCPTRPDPPAEHEHTFSVAPPASMSRPGDCSCGMTWQEAQEAALAELREVQ